MGKDSNLDGGRQEGNRGEGREEGTCIEHLLYSGHWLLSVILFNTRTSPQTCWVTTYTLPGAHTRTTVEEELVMFDPSWLYLHVTRSHSTLWKCAIEYLCESRDFPGALPPILHSEQLFRLLGFHPVASHPGAVLPAASQYSCRLQTPLTQELCLVPPPTPGS